MKRFLQKLFYFLWYSKEEKIKQDTIQVLEKAKKVPESEVRYRQVEKQRRLRLPECPVKFKTSYNEEIAKKEAKRLEGGKLKLRAYHCEFCPHWHLSHKKLK